LLKGIAQSPLGTFPRNVPIDGEVAIWLRTCQDSCCANLLRTCYGEATGKLVQRDFVTRKLLSCCRLAMGKSPTCYSLALGKRVKWILALSEQTINKENNSTAYIVSVFDLCIKLTAAEFTM